MTRLSARLIVAVALALTASLLGSAPSVADPDPGDPGPINAANTFKWGDPVWREEWEPDVDTPRPVDPYWIVRGPGLVQEQHGMLTLNTTRRGDLAVTLDRKPRRVGRWEIRLRSRSYDSDGAAYKVVTSLIPRGNRHCGGRDIVLEAYRPGDRSASFAIHTLPNRTFTASRALTEVDNTLGDDEWHTFAVEITKKRISWFVDARVITSERRPAALSGTRFTVQFKMVAVAGALMNQSRMQMDWLRYWGLKRPDQKSTTAPQTAAGINPHVC